MQSKSIPAKLPGTVVAQWVKCGTQDCHCARGELHGPYWYRFYRDGSKVRKDYVRPAELEAVRAPPARRGASRSAWRARC
jgi:hypothetical protein